MQMCLFCSLSQGSEWWPGFQGPVVLLCDNRKITGSDPDSWWGQVPGCLLWFLLSALTNKYANYHETEGKNICIPWHRALGRGPFDSIFLLIKKCLCGCSSPRWTCSKRDRVPHHSDKCVKWRSVKQQEFSPLQSNQVLSVIIILENTVKKMLN